MLFVHIELRLRPIKRCRMMSMPPVRRRAGNHDFNELGETCAKCGMTWNAFRTKTAKTITVDALDKSQRRTRLCPLSLKGVISATMLMLLTRCDGWLTFTSELLRKP